MATGTTLLDNRQVRKAVAPDARSATRQQEVETSEAALQPDDKGPAGRRALVVVAVAVVTAAVALAVQAPLGLGPVDDAYISLRYAVNWASGDGLCFNIGERVEGYTNFLLVAIQAGLIRLGIPPLTVMSWVPVAALGLLSGVVAWFASRQLFPSRLGPAVVAGLVIGLNPLLICWAAGGLETTLYALLLTTTAIHVAGRDGPAAPIASACLLTLCAMARPEAAMLCPVLAFFVYLKDRSLRDTVRFAVTFGIGFGAYFALRAWHFGQLFPNTFYAKLDYGNSDLAWRGLDYVAHFALAIWPVSVLCLVAVVMRRGAPRWASVFAAVIATQLAVVAYEGGDHFAMFRFAAPVTPLMGLLALQAVVALAQRRGALHTRTGAVLATGLTAVALSGFLAGRAVKRDEPDSVTQYLRFLQESDYARQWTAIGEWLSRNAEPDSSVATVAIGAVGFYSGMRLVDPHGLIDPAIAHAAGNLGTGYAGHEKFDVQRVLSQRPSYVLLINHLSLEPIPHDSVGGNLWGQFAPRLHRDPGFARQYRYEQVPIAGRWLNVHVRRDLPRLPTPQSPDA